MKVSAEVAVEVVRIRKTHGWGGAKIREVLKCEHPELEVPTPRTIHRILVRSGFLQEGRRKRREKRRNGPTTPPRVRYEKCNDVWTVDFKGWWLAINKERCEPLTVRDAHSRFILTIEVLPSTKMGPVRAIFERLFREYGLPAVILTDNGPPWVMTHGEFGLTQLSAWWLSLGVNHVRTRPGKPCDNGAHERMHRDMAEALESFKALTRKDQQTACDRFRHDFNCHRPHAALGMKRPADVYVRSEVVYEDKATEPVYPEGFTVRKVQKRGAICLLNKVVFVSLALCHQYVGLELTEPGVFNMWYFNKKIGEIDVRGNRPRVKPINWKDTAVLLPMTA